MRPPSSRKPPNVRAYALMTHDRSADANSRSVPIDGSATVTIAMSRMRTNCVVASRASARPFDGALKLCLTFSVMYRSSVRK